MWCSKLKSYNKLHHSNDNENNVGANKNENDAEITKMNWIELDHFRFVLHLQ